MGKNKQPVVLCIGKTVQDVFLKSDEFDPKKEGRVVYTHLPLGAKLGVDEVHFATGGNAGNVAVSLARQGLDVKYMWSLGYDPASHTILSDLDNEGVDTSWVLRGEHYQGGYSAILLSPDGERTILNYKGKSVPKSGEPLDFAGAISEADWIYPSSLADGGLSLLDKVVTLAKSHGTKVMLNPAGPELAESDKLKAILEDVDILCVNKDEMKSLVHGESLEELVRHGLSYCPVVIVSDGPNGVCASDGKTIVKAGMYEDVPVIDRTGAGDAFAGGFLSHWIKGKSLEESIIFASANSTSVVSKIGAKDGILHHGVKLHDMPMQVKNL